MSTRELPFGTILVADDNEDLRELLMRLLRAQGYRVLAAADGPAALDILLHDSVDLALVDVLMPGKSGLAVCRAAKQRPETRLTTNRPYRAALKPAEAFATLRKEAAGGWWDASLVSSLEAMTAAAQTGQPRPALALASDVSTRCA